VWRLTWQTDAHPRQHDRRQVEVKVLMSHEMETGLRKDAQGKIIPAHFIRNVT